MSDLTNRIQAARARRVALANMGLRLHQSPLLALAEVQESGNFKELIKLPILASCGWTTRLGVVGQRNDRDVCIGWLPTAAMICMTRHWLSGIDSYRLMDEERQSAYLIGALTNYSAISSEELTVESIDNARRSMKVGVQAKPPTQTMVKNAINSLKKIVLKDVLSVRELNKNGITHFPWDLLLAFPADVKTSILDTAADPRLDVVYEYQAETLLALRDASNWASVGADTVKAVWETLSMESIAVFFLMESQSTNFSSRMIAASLFVSSATLAKSAFTEQWLSSRLSRLEVEITGIQDDNTISTAVLTSYAAIFPKEKKDMSLLYNTIVYNYTVASHAGLNSIKWILEQARASNVSALIGLADTMTTHRTLTATILANQFGDDQVKAVSTLALKLIMNPWLSLVAPDITMAQYPDLAYIGMTLGFFTHNRARGRKGQYGGQPDVNSKKGKVYLDSFVESIISLSSKSGQSALSVEAIALVYGMRAIQAPDNHWKFTPVGEIRTGEASGSGSAVEHLVAANNFDSWLSSNLINDKDRAFQLIMSNVRIAAGQQVLEEISVQDSVNPEMKHLKTTELTTPLKEAARTLGLSISDSELNAPSTVLTKLGSAADVKYQIPACYLYEVLPVVVPPPAPNDEEGAAEVEAAGNEGEEVD